MNKNNIFRTKTLFSLILLILLIPAAFAGWFDFLKGGFTGNAAHSMQVTVQNAFPNITFVSSIPEVVVSPGSTVKVNVWFIVNDSNGVAALKESSSSAVFSKSGELTRSNTSCRRESNITGYSSNFTCSVDIYYYDAGSGWSVNVSINDTADNKAYNDTTTFDIQSYLELNLTTDTVTFNAFAPGAKNQTPATPINITNIGNKNITNISITAFDLIGQTGTAIGWQINTTEFRSGNDSIIVCNNGATLLNNTAVNINITTPRYNHGTPTSSINYCIPTVPEVGAGIYNTTNTWTITATG